MRKWKYRLGENGKDLRKVLGSGKKTLEVVQEVYDQIINCLKCLKIKLTIWDREMWKDDIDDMIEDMDLARPKLSDDYYTEEENLNYNLKRFYDLMDEMRVWLGLL